MNGRPTPNIEGTNEAEDYRRHLRTVLPRIESLPGIVGVVLHGGLSRGYADDLSEIDLTLVLDDETNEQWSDGRGPIATGVTTIDGQLYDVSVSSVAELDEEWTETERWDRSYAEILYDPTGAVGTAFEAHRHDRPGADELEGYLFDCWWHFRLAADCWIHRDDPFQGQFALNGAVTALLKAAFAANREYVPHEKWLVHLSRSLEWTPEGWSERLAAALRSDPTSMAAVERRQEAIEGLWTDVDDHARSEFDPDLPVRFMQRTFYRALETLVEAGAVALDEWDSAFGLELLNRDPFASVTRMEEDAVVLDEEALRALDREQLYEWHFEVVEALVSDDHRP